MSQVISNKSNNQIVSISNGTIIRTIFWSAFFYCLYQLQDLLISLFVAIVMASSINPVAKYFKRYNIPRALTVSLVFLLGISFVVLTIMLFVPLIADDIARFITNLPSLIERINVFNKDLGLKELSNYLSQVSKDISKGQVLEVLKNFVLGANSVVHTTGIIISKVFSLFIIFVLSFYLAIQENGVENFLRIITPKSKEIYIIDLWTRSQAKIARWAQGQLLLGLIIAIIVYIVLIILGIPYALLLAMLAFIGELIPLVGIMLSLIPAALIALSHGGIEQAGMLTIIFFVISQFESHILQPRIMDRVVGVPALVVIIALLVGASLLGFWGVLLAVPLAAITMELLHDLDKEKHRELDINY